MKIQPGDRVRLIHMPSDPDPIKSGEEGVVMAVHEGSLPQVHVSWDSGRKLALLPETDQFEVVGHELEHVEGCPRCGNKAFDGLSLTPDGHFIGCDDCGWNYGDDDGTE